MSAAISLNAVKYVKITQAAQLGTDRVMREIVIYTESGTPITIELTSHNDEMKLEIE